MRVKKRGGRYFCPSVTALLYALPVRACCVPSPLHADQLVAHPPRRARAPVGVRPPAGQSHARLHLRLLLQRCASPTPRLPPPSSASPTLAAARAAWQSCGPPSCRPSPSRPSPTPLRSTSVTPRAPTATCTSRPSRPSRRGLSRRLGLLHTGATLGPRALPAGQRTRRRPFYRRCALLRPPSWHPLPPAPCSEPQVAYLGSDNVSRVDVTFDAAEPLVLAPPGGNATACPASVPTANCSGFALLGSDGGVYPASAANLTGNGTLLSLTAVLPPGVYAVGSQYAWGAWPIALLFSAGGGAATPGDPASLPVLPWSQGLEQDGPPPPPPTVVRIRVSAEGCGAAWAGTLLLRTTARLC